MQDQLNALYVALETACTKLEDFERASHKTEEHTPVFAAYLRRHRQLRLDMARAARELRTKTMNNALDTLQLDPRMLDESPSEI